MQEFAETAVCDVVAKKKHYEDVNHNPVYRYHVQVGEHQLMLPGPLLVGRSYRVKVELVDDEGGASSQKCGSATQ